MDAERAAGSCDGIGEVRSKAVASGDDWRPSPDRHQDLPDPGDVLF